METDFNKYKPEELVGKLVLHASGSVHAASRAIRKITKATATKIEIEGSVSSFNYNGGEKGRSNDRCNWGSTNSIKLISEDEAKELIAEWKRLRLTREMVNSLKDKINSLTYEQLIEITKIIN